MAGGVGVGWGAQSFFGRQHGFAELGVDGAVSVHFVMTVTRLGAAVARMSGVYQT